MSFAYHQALLAAVTFAPPYGPYARFENNNLHFSNLPQVKTIACWVRKSYNTLTDSVVYLLDNRPDGSGFYSGNDRSAITLFAEGVEQVDGGLMGVFAYLVAPRWIKVVLTCPYEFPAPYLARNIEQLEIADIRTYNRFWTPAELADARGPLPTAGLVSRHTFEHMSATQIQDETGHGLHLANLGSPGIFYP